MTNILIIGSGAREHIIAKKLADSSHPIQLFCWASNFNPGLEELCTDLHVRSLDDLEVLIAYAKAQQIDFAIVGPELPLSLGVVDALNASGTPCIGPTQALAKIETSKAFSRQLTTQYRISGSPCYFCFNDIGEIAETLKQLGEDYVIKANGLMGGKGVKISGEHLHSHQEALHFCKEIFSQGQQVVIEEKLEGEEFSLISLVSGQQITHLPAVQDHKRAFVGDTGPNTGGMGSYSDNDHSLPFLTTQALSQAQNINQHSIQALQDYCHQTYTGILYGSYMLTKHGVKLIEFNARFGDPEVLNLLTLLETDFFEVCQALLNQTLDKLSLRFASQATVCKYLVPDGYPTNPEKNQTIEINDLPDNVDIYYGAIEKEDGQLVMTGSRALALVSKANHITSASKQIEQAIKCISGNYFYRPDIGTEELLNKRIKHMQELTKGQPA